MPDKKNSLVDEITYFKNLTEDEYIEELMFERLKLITIAASCVTTQVLR